MRISDVIEVVNGMPNSTYQDGNIKQIKTDSREITNGDIFLTINKGYLYIEEAIDNGAICVITSEQIMKDGILIIYVKNTIESLKYLARYYRNQYKKPVIAITGSVGKTTTKELISGVLSTNRKVLKNEGNKNNIIGVSNTLLSLDNSYDCVVLEVGMNQLMEIHNISLIVKPTISIITKIGTSHIGNLKTKKNIFKAKMEVMAGNKYSILLLNGEDSYLKKVNGIKCNNDEFPYKSFFQHLQINYVLAIKACLIMGMDYDDIILSLESLPLYNQRMNIIYKNDLTIIDDSYNASYESIVGGLEYLSSLSGRKIIILGDILELGQLSSTIHHQLINNLKRIKDSIYFFVGEHFKVVPFGHHFKSTDELISNLHTYSFNSGDVIYVKASHAWQFERVVNFLTS